MNVWFLGIVALWRLALLASLHARVSRLPTSAGVVATVLPVMLVIGTLTLLNLERAVFEVMAGLRYRPPNSVDSAYAVLVLLSLASVYGAMIAIPWYLIECFAAWRTRDAETPG